MPTKLRSGTVLYGASPKVKLGQANIGDILKAVAQKTGPGVAVKTDGASKLLKEAEQARKQGKCLNPIVQVGVVGKDLVFAIFADKKYDKSTTMLKNYEKAVTTAVLKGHVINLDPTDPIIQKASKTLAKVQGTKSKTGDEADLKKVSKAPIVIVAHGGSAESKGKVYAKSFADKSPKQLVSFLVKDKKLPKKYAGTLYLDGCFTAAGKIDKNYAKKVHGLMVKLGYKYMTVKGNLGAAVTLKDGKESVLDAQEEKRIKDSVKKLNAAWAKIWNDTYAATNDVDGFYADPATKALLPKINKAKKTLKEMKKTYKHDIVDLVGTFGPEKLRKHKWYDKIFK